MERHKREQAAAKDSDHDRAVDDDDDDWDQPAPSRPPILRRRSTDPSSDRPLISRQQARDYNSGSPNPDGEVELLPARFDDYGRPLDGQSPGRHRWTTRRGEFERQPSHSGDWNVRGGWQIGGTDNVAVDRLARTMTDVLDGRQSWLQLLGGVIGGGLLQPEQSSHGRRIERARSRIGNRGDDDDDSDDSREAKNRKRR
jgi:hypothetical protein